MQLKPGDVHIMITHYAHTMQAYDSAGKLVRSSRALTSGTGGDWHNPNGDTPPTTFRMGNVIPTPTDDPSLMASYGSNFIELIDIEGKEQSVGRAGIGMHCGRQHEFAYDLSKPHELELTHGCTRVFEEDMVGWILPTRHEAKAAGCDVYVTVVYER